MKIYLLLMISLLLMQEAVIAQNYPTPTSSDDQLSGYQQRLLLQDSSFFAGLHFTNIGPTVCSGRVVDIDVNPNNPNEMYIAYASGGLWYSNNNGTTMQPIFDHEASMTIGDIAVDWNTGVIWVGTGENNSSRSSYSGVGIYKSTDKGKSWTWKGLGESQHIGRIVLHPSNPNILHVACLGALYTENENRGVYSSYDGGSTWYKSLYINAETGAIDLVMDPSNSNVLYASTWERSRKAWNFEEAGKGSGIYKSTNAGKSWSLLSDENNGFPTGEGVGRIGLEIVKSKSGTILYAVVDNQQTRPEKAKESDKLTKAELNEMSVDSFLALTDKMIASYLEEQGFPEKYTVDTIRTLIKKGTITPATLVEYTQDANSQLFDTEIIGTEVYTSTNNGKSWHKTHEGYLDDVFYTYGYYFGQIRASQRNPKKLYIMGVPILKSEDGGATWTSIGGRNVHGDHHALWINPKLDGHLILGNDGGLHISYDDGMSWMKCNHPQVAQFYSVAVDMAKPYNVYGGLQDNGVWVGPSTAIANDAWQASGHNPYKTIMGGDGMQVAVDTRDNNTVYTGFQFGNYYKVSRSDDREESRITPVHDLGQRPYRWNWESPIHLSNHNQDILYMGADRVFRSFDQGQHFDAISDDLTSGSREGDVAYGTIVSLHESSLKFGLLYAGSDDGHVHVTKDGGNTWKLISAELPESLWVSSVFASAHEVGRVYISLNGYRFDHFESYVYKSDDYGDHWTRVATSLPAEPVNVVKEDPVNENIIYIGTDHGLYVSLDQGQHVMLLGDLPFVPVHDLVIHPRDKELVAATHGRSLYKANVRYLQMLRQDMGDTLTCFNEKGEMFFSTRFGNRSASWMEYNEPSFTFPVFTTSEGKGLLQVYSDSLLVYEEPIELKRGLSEYTYHLEMQESVVNTLNEKVAEKNPENETIAKKADNGKYYLIPGDYQIKISRENNQSEVLLKVKSRD